MSEAKEIPISTPESEEAANPPEKLSELYNEALETPGRNQDNGETQNSPGGDSKALKETGTLAGDEQFQPECLPPEAESPEEELEKLRKEFDKLRKEKEQTDDLYLRTHAEFENFKKRLERNKADSIRYANESLICELLTIIDNFELAIAATDEKKDFRSLDEGVKLILKQLKDVLAKEGLTEIPAVKEPFDPAHHEAIRQVFTNDHPPDTVVEEHRKGYKLKGKLIRAAMVAVSRKEEKTLS